MTEQGEEKVDADANGIEGIRSREDSRCQLGRSLTPGVTKTRTDPSSELAMRASAVLPRASLALTSAGEAGPGPLLVQEDAPWERVGDLE